MMSPATTGPATVPTPSLQFVTTLAAVSSSGVRATLGSRVDCVGRVMVKGTPATIAAAYTTAAGAPSRMTAPVTAVAAAWAT